MATRKTTDKKKSPAGQLRIVAGNWRSRLLQVAALPGLRPTPARVRETLFNWLAPKIQGANCLDLCAGTGALGIEALSRGASHVVFIEQSVVAADTIRSNIASLQATGAEILTVDARRFLKGPISTMFDIVFLDPPFADGLYDELCRLLSEQRWLAADARIYIELDKDQPQPHLPGNWCVLKNKTAGQVRYMLARPED